MATIPRVNPSSRNIGVLPQVQSARSQWGEVGRSVSGVIDAGLSAAQRYQQMQDTRLQTDYTLRKRAEAEQERQQAEAEKAARLESERQAAEQRRVDRDGQYRATQFHNFVTQLWNGSVKVNEDGSTTEVPGVISKTWQQMDAEKKTSFDYLGDIIAEAKRQNFCTTASPEESAAMYRHLQSRMAEYGMSAYKFNAQVKAAKIKEQNDRIEAAINTDLQSAESGDEQAFETESNNAALRKLVLKYGSAIENPDIVLNPTVQDGNGVRTVQLGDLKLRGASDPNDPAYARLKQDYNALIAEHARNRITNLTRFASTDTPIGSVDAESLIQRAEATRQSLKKYGLSTAEQDAAYGAIIMDAGVKMRQVREKRQLEYAGKLDDDLTRIQYEIAPQTDANGHFDPSRAFAYTFDEEKKKNELDALVAAKTVSIDQAQKLYTRYQKMHTWQIELSERVRQANEDKLNAAKPGHHYAQKSNPDVWVALKKEVAEMDRLGTNADVVARHIEDACDAGALTAQHYFDLWNDVHGRRDAANDRVASMVFTEFYKISADAYADAVDRTKRGTAKGNAAVKAVLGSSSAEYVQDGSWSNPDFTVEDVDAADALVRDYLAKRPGDYIGARDTLLNFIEPKSQAARTRTLRERIMKARQAEHDREAEEALQKASGVKKAKADNAKEPRPYDVDAAFAKEDEYGRKAAAEKAAQDPDLRPLM